MKDRFSLYPTSAYRCPICERESDSYDKTDECIKSHRMAEFVREYADFSSRYNTPAFISVEMSDGSIGIFELREVKEAPPAVEVDGEATSPMQGAAAPPDGGQYKEVIS